MLDEGRAFLLVAPHVALFPGLVLFVTVLGVNFLGDALRDALDVPVIGVIEPGVRSMVKVTLRSASSPPG